MDYYTEHHIYSNYFFPLLVGIMFLCMGLYNARKFLKEKDEEIILDSREKEQKKVRKILNSVGFIIAGLIVVFVYIFDMRTPSESKALFKQYFRIDYSQVQKIDIIKDKVEISVEDREAIKKFIRALNAGVPVHESTHNERPTLTLVFNLWLDDKKQVYHLRKFKSCGVLISIEYKNERVGPVNADEVANVIEQLLNSKIPINKSEANKFSEMEEE